MRKFFYGLILLLSAMAAFSQSKPAKLKPTFQMLGSISFLAGQVESSYQWQLVNGFKKNNWFAGVGAGVDYYRYRTVPIFISARRDRLFNRSFFAFADAGVAIPAVKDNQKRSWVSKDAYYTGFYSETGVGCAIPSKRKTSLRFSLGYSFRTLKEKTESNSLIEPWQSSNSAREYRYTFHLTTLKAIVAFSGR